MASQRNNMTTEQGLAHIEQMHGQDTAKKISELLAKYRAASPDDSDPLTYVEFVIEYVGSRTGKLEGEWFYTFQNPNRKLRHYDWSHEFSGGKLNHRVIYTHAGNQYDKDKKWQIRSTYWLDVQEVTYTREGGIIHSAILHADKREDWHVQIDAQYRAAKALEIALKNSKQDLGE